MAWRISTLCSRRVDTTCAIGCRRDLADATQIAPRQVIRIVIALSDYLRLGGHWRLGMRVLSWQLTARREVGDRNGEGTTLNNLGYLARSMGQPEQARDYYTQALAISQEIGAVDNARIDSNNLAYLDRDDDAASDTPGGAPANPQEKSSQRRRRWWQWRR